MGGARLFARVPHTHLVPKAHGLVRVFRCDGRHPYYNQCLHCHSQCGPLASTLSESVGLWPTTLSGSGTTVWASGPHSQWQCGPPAPTLSGSGMAVVFGTRPGCCLMGSTKASMLWPPLQHRFVHPAQCYAQWISS